MSFPTGFPTADGSAASAAFWGKLATEAGKQAAKVLADDGENARSMLLTLRNLGATVTAQQLNALGAVLACGKVSAAYLAAGSLRCACS